MDHHRIIRASLATHRGKEIDTQGDSFFAVFSSSSACVSAVIEMQRAFAAHAWPGGESVRVRMGLHAGEAMETSTGLIGFGVHRAARIAAVGHGGQILLSSPAAGILEDSLSESVGLVDLGLHRLKDLGRPEQIFQLQAEGLAVSFPPLRSLDNPELPNNLPAYLSAFVGRDAELAEVRELIKSSRLVTLTGAGGSGKTRLALQAAAELVDGTGEGVWFVDLAPISQSEQVPAAVAAALGIRQQSGRSPFESLVGVLGQQYVLVVLDNCEHVIDAAAELADLVERNCPRVHLLATSREPLGVESEHVHLVRPLSLPSADAALVDDLDGSDAVKLFVQRARSHDDAFALDDSVAAVVASICRRLDGLPLAIELAAARLNAMSLVHLHERLDQRFRLLTGGSRNALMRQRTLQAMVEWSFDLLTYLESRALRRLSVFVGGFELEAAEAVCATSDIESCDVSDLLASLVDKSLVVAERSSEKLRYRLLETIRQYAAHQLAAAGGDREMVEARRAHGEYYLCLAERIAPELVGPHQGQWLKQLDLEWDNLQATLTYLGTEPEEIEAVLRLGVALFRFLLTRGQRAAAIAHLQAALGRPCSAPAPLRARALYCSAFHAMMRAMEQPRELQTAKPLAEEALEMARSLHDRELEARALALLCAMAVMEDDVQLATLLGQEGVAIARSVGDARLIGQALWGLTWVEPPGDEGRAIYLESVSCLRAAGDIAYLCSELAFLARSELDRGDLDTARRHFEDAIAAAEEIGFSFDLTHLSCDLGLVLLRQGLPREAAPFLRRSLLAARRHGRRVVAGGALLGLACCATAMSEHHWAAQLFGAHEVLDAELTAASTRYSLEPVLENLRADYRARLCRALGDSEFNQTFSMGRRLSFDEVVDLARAAVPVD